MTESRSEKTIPWEIVDVPFRGTPFSATETTRRLAQTIIKTPSGVEVNVYAPPEWNEEQLKGVLEDAERVAATFDNPTLESGDSSLRSE